MTSYGLVQDKFAMSPVLHQLTSDTEHLSQLLRHARVSAMQISPGRFEGELSQFRAGSWCIQQVRFIEGSSTCHGDAGGDRHMVLVPSGPAAGYKLLGTSVDEKSIGLYAPGGEHADVTTSGVVETVLAPPAEFIATCLRHDPEMLPAFGSHHAHRGADALARLKSVIAEVGLAASEGPDSLLCPEISRSLADELSQTLFCALADDAGSSRRGRPPLPRSAMSRLIRERIERAKDEPLFASEICGELKISLPSLRRIFLDWHGVPPARYFLLQRYYLARRRLKEGQFESVTEVAQSCGFWEPSRFAKSYKALFDELPSQTMGRGRPGRHV